MSLPSPAVLKKARIPLLMTLAVLAGCSREPDNAADAVYSGGDILTMAGDQPQYVEALAVKDGKISFVGTKAEADKLAGKDTRQIDLKGRTLLPGFIDAHSHALNYAESLVQANLNPAPVGNVGSIADIITEMSNLKADIKAGDGIWLIGQGYDQDFLVEKRHPTAADLDAAFPNNPVLLIHTSGHMLVANSAALKAAKITSATPDPQGGTIIRKPGSRDPAGLVQENGMLPFFPFLPTRELQSDLELLKRALDAYASHGYTTAAEHLLMLAKMPILEAAADKKMLTIDLVVAPSYLYADQLLKDEKMKWGQYRNGLIYAGIKLTLDGSPQGKTAYISKPYLTPVQGCSKDCRGFPNMTQEEVNTLFLKAYQNNVQIFAHCNGDASTDMMLSAHAYAEKSLGKFDTDRRTVIIHSQIMRPDQLDAYKKTGLLPSFFTNHVYYWGDIHLANLGIQRGEYISPLRSAMDKGIRASNHTDAIVTPIDPMFLLWTSVNRLTRSGRILGANERVTPFQGLQAITGNAAYMYREEATKGTLEVGKLADMVILESNPLKVDPAEIYRIRVMETLKEGKTIYSAPADLAAKPALVFAPPVAAPVEESKPEAAPVKAEAVASEKPKAPTAADKKAADAKAKAAAASTAAKQQAKRSNEKKPLAPKPAVVETPVAEEAPKPKEVRFNMTQDGKKMTPEDFEAWMKAQGIRIVPAKPAEPPKTDTKKDGG
ncbi:MAG: amidohydrolase [Arenimonas sp.]